MLGKCWVGEEKWMFSSFQSIDFVILNCCPSGPHTLHTSLKILSHLARLGTGAEMLGGVSGEESGMLLGGSATFECAAGMCSRTAPATQGQSSLTLASSPSFCPTFQM